MTVARIVRLTIGGSGKDMYGKNAGFEGVFAKLLEGMRKNEPGALEHILCKSKDEPNVYVLYEEYENEEAMLAHSRTIHFNMIGIQIAGFVVKSAEIENVEPVMRK